MTEGEKAIRFIEKLKCPAGTDFAGEPAKLLEWQKQYIEKLLATNDEGRRIVRDARLWLARGSGKTTLTAFLVCWFLFRQKNGSIVVQANTIKEAQQLYDFVASIIDQDEGLRSVCRVYKGNQKRIICNRTVSTCEVISSLYKGKLGGNCSIYIAEEAGHYTEGKIFAAIQTSMHKRVKTDPLIITLSTAGDDLNSFGYQLFQETKARLELNDDPTFLGVVYQGDPAKWDDLEEWKKANPSLTEISNLSFCEGLIKQAKANPLHVPILQRFYLNHWSDSTDGSPAIPMDAWDRCPVIDPQRLKTVPCNVGIDIGSVDDFSAVSAEFKVDGIFCYLLWYFTPADTLAPRANKAKKNYEAWTKTTNPATGDKFLTTIPGDVMTSEDLRQFMHHLRTRFNIKDVAIDRYFNANDLTINLAKDGFRVVPIGAGTRTISPCLKDFVGLIQQGKVCHFNNPILRWNASAAVAYVCDEQANISISKRRAKGKTDGLMACLYAHAREMEQRPKGAGSIGFVKF